MWKIVIILMYLCGTTLATPVVGLKKNMEIFMADDVKTEQMSEEKEELIPSSNEKSELAMATLNLPSNATSIRADIVDGFSCKNREYGYYADVENDCQIFHVCMPVVYADGKENTFRWSFICPEETVFSQDSFTCMRAEDISFGCEESVKFYELNRNFGIVDSSMEVQSNEADSNSEMNMMSDKQMHESMTENKNTDMQKETQMVEGEKIQKIQKRVDDLKPDTQKPIQSHKKKNSLRKNPVRKLPKTTTTTAIPITTVTAEQAPSSIQPTTSLPLEVEITTAKIIEKLTTKHPRFTRRPDINKENKKKIEQVQKAEPITVAPIKDSTKKPFKPDSLQKRKRPHITSSLKHKFNGEEKPLKNILKTSEIVKPTPTEPQKEQNVPVKIFKRPPIPEPILIKVEEQPAEPINIVQTIQQTENIPVTVTEVIKPLPIESESPVVSFTKPETENINQIESKPLSVAAESDDVTNDLNKETNLEFLKTDMSSSALESAIKQNENELMNIATATLINDPNPTTVINMNIENIPSQESEIKTDEKKTVSEEKIEESMPPKKEEELLEVHVKNESNNEDNKEEMNLDNNNNEAEIPINNNKNVVVDDSVSGNNNQQSGIDQQSMIINLISSLVNAENSKVDDVPDKIENSEYVLPQTEQQEQQNLVKEPEVQEQAPNLDINNEKLLDEQKQEQQENEQQKEPEQQKQESNNEHLQMTTNNILSDDMQQQNNEEIMNSDHVFKILTSTNNEGDHLVENLNSNKNPEVNDFDAMQKFMYQQNKLYNHMTHIPVKLLTDDQYEDIHTKGALTNSDALNVIQRIEQLLQDEVKADDQSSVVDTKINEPIVPSETEGEVKEEIKSAEIQPTSSEEIKPIYHRFIDPIEANLLKDNAMSVDENKPIVKDTAEPSPAPLPASESVSDLVVKADVKIPEPTIIETPVEVKLESVASKDQPSLLEILKIPINEDSVKEEEAQKSEPIKTEVLETKEKEVEQVQVPIESVVSDDSIALKKEPLESELSSKPEEIKLEESVPISEVFESEKLKSELLPESTLEIKKNLEESNTSNTETPDVLRTSSRSLKNKSRIVDPRKRRFLFKADA